MYNNIKYWKEVIKSRVGTGDTAKSATMENYWEAELTADGKIKMNLLDNSYEHTGYAEMAMESEMGTRFTPLEDFEVKPKSEEQIKSDQITARAERHLAQNELNSAEFEFTKALALDEKNIRANLGLGKTFLAQGEEEKAKAKFVQLAVINEVLEPDNKHAFNELGIQMRKLGMFKEACEHYARALNISKSDENLWFNQSRTLFEGGEVKKAIDALKEALTINPGFEEGKQFLLYIKQQIQKGNTA